MASSASLASPPPPPPPKPVDSAVDEEGEESEYEYEYEEIEVEEEVEEEIEVEEEVEEEVEMELETDDDEAKADPVKNEDENEIGEDLTPVRGLNQENDTIRTMELEEHEGVAHGVNVSNPPLDVPNMQKNIGDDKPSKSSNNEEFHAVCEDYIYKGENIYGDNNPTTPFNNSGDINLGKPTPFTGDINASSQKDTAIEAVAEIRQMEPRFHLPHMRSREPSPSDEYYGENKKMKIACEFHAKGWCIRGSSCRFLHIKDGSDAAAKEKEASSSACTQPQRWENPKLNSENEKVVFQKDGTVESAPLEDERRRLRLNFDSNNYSYQIAPFFTERYFGSSSWNPKDHEAHNFRVSGLQCRPSVPSLLQRSIPPLTNSVLKTPSINHNFYKSTFSSFDWEPSAPFVPSHEITEKLLLKENLSDPVRDSIDEKTVKDGKKKISHSDQGSSVKDINVQTNIQIEEEKILNSARDGNTKEDNILTSRYDDQLKSDKVKDEPLLEVGGSKNEVDVNMNVKQESISQSESTDFKTFQNKLIESVKELVKPTWREGFLSRGAHKVIVKKAVDKILISIPPDQIPRTIEASDFYLSSSQPKIAKLVEAYISKYGTS